MKFIWDYVKCNTDLQVILQSYNFKMFSHLTRLISRIFLQMLPEDFTLCACVRTCVCVYMIMYFMQIVCTYLYLVAYVLHEP
jgi:hypothetical protein